MDTSRPVRFLELLTDSDAGRLVAEMQEAARTTNSNPRGNPALGITYTMYIKLGDCQRPTNKRGDSLRACRNSQRQCDRKIEPLKMLIYFSRPARNLNAKRALAHAMDFHHAGNAAKRRDEAASNLLQPHHSGRISPVPARNSFSKLCVRHTIFHSAPTAANPRIRNRRTPRTSLNLTNTGSTVVPQPINPALDLVVKALRIPWANSPFGCCRPPPCWPNLRRPPSGLPSTFHPSCWSASIASSLK